MTTVTPVEAEIYELVNDVVVKNEPHVADSERDYPEDYELFPAIRPNGPEGVRLRCMRKHHNRKTRYDMREHLPNVVPDVLHPGAVRVAHVAVFVLLELSLQPAQTLSLVQICLFACRACQVYIRGVSGSQWVFLRRIHERQRRVRLRVRGDAVSRADRHRSV